MSDLKDAGKQPVNDERRKVVRNLLTGAGVTAGVGALATTEWMKPVINSVVLPAHAQMSVVTAVAPDDPMTPVAKCCPYYFDVTQNWCYDDLGMQNGDSGLIGSFSYLNWVQPDNCPTPPT